MPDLRLIKGKMSDSKIDMSGCPFQDSTERLYLSTLADTCKGGQAMAPLTLPTMDSHPLCLNRA